MLSSIERATNQPITPMDLPTVGDINQGRVDRFKAKLLAAANRDDLDLFSQMIAELQHEQEISSEQLAAAAAYLAQGDTPLILDEKELKQTRAFSPDRDSGAEQHSGKRFAKSDRAPKSDKPTPRLTATALKDFPDMQMARYQLDVGRQNQVKPSNIVGAIANEAELESKYIGEIEIREEYSTVDLPADMPKGILSLLKKVRVGGKPMGIKVFTGEPVTGGNESAPRKRSERRSHGDHAGAAAPKKKSYNSKRNKPNSGASKAKSEYAKKKRKQRKEPKPNK
jgi:ATP-dependent RNA helicase DeaD